MIEVSVLLLMLGAGVAHAQWSVAVVATGVFCVAIFVTRNIRGLFFAGAFAMVVLFGFFYTEYRMSTLIHAPLGAVDITAHVTSVNRELTQNVLVVKTADGAKIQIYTTDNTLLPGDSVHISGIVKLPEDFETNTGRLFGYTEYMDSKGITGIMRRGSVQHSMSNNTVWSVSRVATIVRFRIADILAQYVSFPEDGIAAGMFVGYQGGIPDDINDLFRTTGVLHVLVLSGYNITLLATFLSIVLKRLPYHLRVLITGISIAFLVVVSGAGVASARAGIMGGIALLGGVTLRSYKPLRALAIAIMFFFFISPLTTIADPGFQLSALATCFMIVAIPKVSQCFSFIPQTKTVSLRELVTLAVGMPILMLPYTMYFSGLAPLAAIPANIVLAVVTPLITMLSAITTVFALLTPIASLVGIVTSTLIHTVVSLLVLFNHLPQWNTPTVSGWCVASIYVGVIEVFYRKELHAMLVQKRSALARRSS